MRHKKSLTKKFMWFALLSLLIALVGLFFIYYFLTYVVQLPGTSTMDFYNALAALTTIFLYTPWFLWLLIVLFLFILSFYLLSRRTIRRLNRVSGAINRVAEGKYDARLRVSGRDDISALEENVNEMAKKIEYAIAIQKQTERAKDEFITNIAHDLRTPLMSILGYLAFIRERPLSQQQVQEYVSIAYRKSKRMEKLIEDLFELSQLTAEYKSTAPGWFSLKQFLLQIQDEAYPLLEEQGMQMRVFLEGEDLRVYADGNLLSRVFDNLTSNAVRYARAGKYIDVYAHAAKSAVVMTLLTHANPIPQDKLDRIFDKLYRVEESRAEQTGGTGLGLAICKSIVELHGGNLRARATLDGTAFDIWLPQPDAAQAEAQGAAKRGIQREQML